MYYCSISLPLRFQLLSRWISSKLLLKKIVLSSLQTNPERKAFLYRKIDHHWVLCILYHPISGLAALSQLTKIPPTKQRCCLFQRLTPASPSPTSLRKKKSSWCSITSSLILWKCMMGNLGETALQVPTALNRSSFFIFKYPKINFSKFRSVWRQVLICLNISFYVSLLSVAHTFFQKPNFSH